MTNALGGDFSHFRASSECRQVPVRLYSFLGACPHVRPAGEIGSDVMRSGGLAAVGSDC